MAAAAPTSSAPSGRPATRSMRTAAPRRRRKTGPAPFSLARCPRPGGEPKEKAMKSLIFAAALLAAGGALAQTMPEPAPGAGTVTSAPGNSAPERDARGIPVISDPAEVPAGFNQPAQ